MLGLNDRCLHTSYDWYDNNSAVEVVYTEACTEYGLFPTLLLMS
jgi:hypothetical protein